MKRILSIITIIATMLALFSLTGCKKTDAPTGMKLVRGGDDVGYYFYGPEEWVVANMGDISCTYASKIDTSSITFTETKKPDGTVKEYFDSEKTKFPYEITVKVENETCLFGADSITASKYIYSYAYKGIIYTCMQIFAEHDGRFYIFTYTAANSTKSEDKSFYEFYIDKVTAVIENIKFTEKKASPEEAPVYEKDADGYNLISDKSISGFMMYVPEAYRVDYSSVLVSASREDGTNVNMSTATYTGVTNKDYWNARKNNIIAFADKTQDAESGEQVTTFKEIEIEKRVELEGTNWALAYEYTYTFEGVDYHVYQVLIVEGAVNGYVFTYTAREEHYAEHMGEINTILGKIKF